MEHQRGAFKVDCSITAEMSEFGKGAVVCAAATFLCRHVNVMSKLIRNWAVCENGTHFFCIKSSQRRVSVGLESQIIKLKQCLKA
jgi:uncharacterized protein YsxB (DUF464 family)